YVVEELSPPTVKLAEPSVTSPAPASEPIVSLKLARSNVASLATVTAILAFGILRLRTHPGMSEDEDGRSETGKNV
ncbi:MAG: hypothetical protein EB020_04170, partial [Proteobacteria bacterium]|nr:hypothetical protein [Pseudomonadota bacterium]